jgi:hypothetical protein
VPECTRHSHSPPPAAGDGFSISLATSSPDPLAGGSVTQDSPGTQDFGAFVGDDAAGSGQPGFVVVSSNEVAVSWWRFVIINPWGAVRG